MTFATKELSIYDGRPLELLQIRYGDTGEWNYTTAEEEISYDAKTYVPIAMKRDNIEPTGDASRASIKIGLPQDAPIVELYRVQPPSGLITVTLFGHHYDDATGLDAFVVLYKGRITSVALNPPWFDMSVENVFSSLSRIAPRRRWSTQCGHALYNLGCNVVKADHAVAASISAVSGNTATSADATAVADNYYAGGMVEWVHPTRGTTERLMIRASNGTTGVLTFTAQPVGLTAGMSATIYPGCDHLIATCESKFGNSVNYGGQPFRPAKNPYGGSMLY